MKRVLFVLGLLGLLAAASACGGGDDVEVTLPGGDGEVKVTTGGDLPDEFPDDFPIFENANLTGSIRGEQEGQSGFFVTWETDASVEDVTDFYTEALDKAPWQSEGVFSSGEGALIAFTRADNADFGGGVTVSGSDGKTQFVVFMGEGAGLAPSDEAEEEQPTPASQTEEEATPGEGEEPPAQAELPDESELPGDYPADVAPIPDGARVTDASSFSSDGQATFSVTFLTKDDPESIVDFYDSEVPGDGWSETGSFSSDGDVSATYGNEAEGGSLVVSASRSDTYEGYTEVFILLTVGQ